jgi:hypothetical protein
MPPKESIYYPAIQPYLQRLGYTCNSKGRGRQVIDFITRGIAQINMDVFGVRSAASRHSTDLEVVAVEVKRHKSRASLRDLNQALSYRRLAHYCYLAMPREYTEKEAMTAADIGIGLLSIGQGKRVHMVSRSTRFQPSESLLREFLRTNLSIAKCSICGSFSLLYDIPKGQQREGGGWRRNVFTPKGKEKWVYFCKQCSTRFQNALSERKLIGHSGKSKRFLLLRVD